MKFDFWKRPALLAVMSLGSVAATAADYYVKATANVNGTGSSWNSPYTPEQFAKALLTAPKGTTFYLTEGTYYPMYSSDGERLDNKKAVFYAKEAVNIIGGFPKNAQVDAVADPKLYQTIINGDRENDDVATVDEYGNVSIANRSDNHYTLMNIEIPDGGKVVLKNLMFKGSADDPKGSPAALIISGSTQPNFEYMDEVEIENCTFENAYHGVNINNIYGGYMRNCQFTNMQANAINLYHLEGISFRIDQTTVENARNGLTFNDAETGLMMYNSTFVNAPLRFDNFQGIANQRQSICSNTFIDVYPDKKSQFSEAFNYLFAGNILGDIEFLNTDFEVGNIISHDNVCFSQSTIPSFFTDEDKSFPREYIGSFLDGRYDKMSSVFTPNLIRLGGLSKTVSVVGDTYRDGTSIRFNRSNSICGGLDQRGKERGEMTCAGAVDMVEETAVFDCKDGTILFKEDFGGNSPYDPLYSPVGLQNGSMTLIYDGEIPLAGYHSNTYNAGCYSIRKEALRRSQNNDGTEHLYGGWWADFGDHTSEDDLTRGYMLQIDMSSYAAVFYTVKIDNLCENTNLYLSMWGHSVYNNENVLGNTKIVLSVEDTKGNVLQKKNVEFDCQNNNWEQYGMDFTVPLGHTSIVYKIYSDGGHMSNDFCLDDIEVRLCKPKVNIEETVIGDCQKSYTLVADYDNIGGYINPVEFTWFRNDNKTYELTGWEKVAKGRTLEVKDGKSNSYYRCVISSHGTEASFDRCNSASDIIEIEPTECGQLFVASTTDTLCASGYDTLWASFKSTIDPDAEVKYKWFINYPNDWTECGEGPYYVLHNQYGNARGNREYRCVATIGEKEPELEKGMPTSEVITIYYGPDQYVDVNDTIFAGETYNGVKYTSQQGVRLREKVYPIVNGVVDTTACPIVKEILLTVLDYIKNGEFEVSSTADTVCASGYDTLWASFKSTLQKETTLNFRWYISWTNSKDKKDWTPCGDGPFFVLHNPTDKALGNVYYKCVLSEGETEPLLGHGLPTSEVITIYFGEDNIVNEEVTIGVGESYKGKVYDVPGDYQLEEKEYPIIHKNNTSSTSSGNSPIKRPGFTVEDIIVADTAACPVVTRTTLHVVYKIDTTDKIIVIPTEYSLCASGWDTLWASYKSTSYPEVEVNYRWYISWVNSDNDEDWTACGDGPFFVLHNPIDSALGNVYYRCVASLGETEPTIGNGLPTSEIIKIYFGEDEMVEEEATIKAGDSYRGTVYDIPGDYEIDIKEYPSLANGVGVDTTACPIIKHTKLHVEESDAYTGEEVECGEILFKEDFGGNDVNEPLYSEEELKRGSISLSYNGAFPLAVKNEESGEKGVYGLRKEAIRRKSQHDQIHSHVYSGWYADFGDHTYENDYSRGYMMQIDMANTPSVFYQVQIDNLVSGEDLELSMWARDVNIKYDASIRMTVTDLQGNELGSEIIELAKERYVWERHAVGFIVPENQSSIIFKIWSPGGHEGNDFCLDDIYVYKNCGYTGENGLKSHHSKGDHEDIEEVKSDDNVIYPNPAGDVLNISVEYETAVITDMQGRTLMVAYGEKAINVNSLTSGCYLLRITSVDGSSVYKFIKK